MIALSAKVENITKSYLLSASISVSLLLEFSTCITSCFHVTLHVSFPIQIRVSLSLWTRVSEMKCHFPVNKLYFMTQSRSAEKISHGTRCYCLSNFHVILSCPNVSITCLFLVINLHVIKYSEGNGTKLRQATTK